MVLVLDGSIELDETLFELRRDGAAVPLEPQAFDVLRLPGPPPRPGGAQGRADGRGLGRPLRQRDGRHQPDQAGPPGARRRRPRPADHPDPARPRLPLRRRRRREPRRPRRRRRPRARGPAGAPVRYTTSDGLHIAYQVTGGGDIDIVLISGFVSHLDLDWDDPRHAHFLDRLGTMGRLIRFDKRGTGMSDRPPGVPDLETRMHDVLAVMDAVGSERAVARRLLRGRPDGADDGGDAPRAGLVAGALRQLRPSDLGRGLPVGADPDEERAAYTDDAGAPRWDWEADLLMRCPSGDKAMQQWWSRRMRAAATPGTVRALMDMNSLVDVRALLPTPRCPTLVVHRTGDALCSTRGEPLHRRADPRRDADRLLEGADHFVVRQPRPDPRRHRAVHRRRAHARAPPGPGRRRARRRTRPDPAAPAGARRAGTVRRAAAATSWSSSTDRRPAYVPRWRRSAGTRAAGVGLSIAEVAVDGGPVSGPSVDRAAGLAATPRPVRCWSPATAAGLLAGSGIRLAPTPDPDVLRVVPG